MNLSVLPEETANNVLQQTHCLLLNELVDHVAQDGANCIETLVRLAYVRKTNVVQQDLLHDENGHGLAELRTCLHDTEAEGYDLGRKEEVDDFGRVILDQGANHAKGCQAKVLERTRLGRGV